MINIRQLAYYLRQELVTTYHLKKSYRILIKSAEDTYFCFGVKHQSSVQRQGHLLHQLFTDSIL